MLHNLKKITHGHSLVSSITRKMGAYSKVMVAFRKYPLLRGMASYSVIWPLSSLIQQSFEGKTLGE